MNNQNIVVLDHDLGNIKSISNALREVGANVLLTRNFDQILESSALVLPGVGAFKHGMSNLKEYGLVEVIHEYAKTSKPILGICLGMQLLFEESSEFGQCAGLGLIPGIVQKLNVDQSKMQKLPHTGWNTIKHPESGVGWDGTILESVPNNSDMYFVHSYAAKPSQYGNVLSVTSYYDEIFCSAVKYNNIYGCQFHPEKSSDKGLSILSNFVKLAIKE